MRRSDLLKLMGLAAGGRADAPLANKWYVHHGWSAAARAASLAVRQAKAAARSSSPGSSGGSSSDSSSSSSDSTSGGGGDPDSSSSPVHVSGFTVNGSGKVSVGFTDYSVDPPVNRYLTEGGEDGGWTIKSADYDAGTAVLVKDGQEIAVSMESGGGDTARVDSGQLASEQAADQAEWQDGQGGAGSPIEDFANAGIDAFHDKYGRQPVSEDDCKEAAVLSDATTDSDLEAVEEWIRERAADDADAAQTDAPGGNGQAGLPEGVTLGGASGTEEVAGGKTRADWFELAQAAFKAKYGREPVEDSEVAEAETLAHVPAVFRSDAPEAGAGVGSRDDHAEHPDQSEGDVPASGEQNFKSDELSRMEDPNSVESQAIHDRADEMVRGEGPDAEPPSLQQLVDVFRADLVTCKTPADRLAALKEYNASLEAGQIMWSNASVSAFEALNGRKPESDSDWRVAERLAGVPKPFLRGSAVAGADSGGSATENRRYLRLARLSNRTDAAAVCLLENVGWTDEARLAALAVRRAKAATRIPITANPDVPPVGGFAPPGEGTIVTTADGGVSAVINGKVTRIGNKKVLTINPDGTITLKVGAFRYPLGSPKDWNKSGSIPGYATMKLHGVTYIRAGTSWISLEDGSFKAAQDPFGSLDDGRMTVIHRRLGNRVRSVAVDRLANTGWTDEARAASLAVRRGGSSDVKRDPLSEARDLLAAFPGSLGNRPSPETFDAARKEFAYTYCRDPKTPQEWAQAFYFLFQFPHANRLCRSGGSVLANTGWTDAAREAALAVRRAKADARDADGFNHIFNSTANIKYTLVNDYPF